MITSPTGLDQIISTYGDPNKYVNTKEQWEALILVRRQLPFQVKYSYSPTPVTSIRAHRALVDLFVEVLTKCNQVVPPGRLIYSGIYCWRAKRNNPRKFSTHTWGIAIDLDAANNKMGDRWDGGIKMIHPTIVTTFKSYGFTWGGDWKTPDCMHFQYCKGY